MDWKMNQNGKILIAKKVELRIKNADYKVA